MKARERAAVKRMMVYEIKNQNTLSVAVIILESLNTRRSSSTSSLYASGGVNQ